MLLVSSKHWYMRFYLSAVHHSLIDAVIAEMVSEAKKTITNAEDAVANEVAYHDLCWIKAKRDAEPKPTPVDNFTRTLSDIELLYLVEHKLSTTPLLS